MSERAAIREPLIDLRRDARKILGVLLTAFVINGLFYLALVHPRVRETARLIAERDSFEDDLEAARTRTGQLREARDRIVAQEQGLDYVYNDLLGKKIEKMVQVEREIARICQEFNINPEEVRMQTEEVPEGRVERFIMSLPLQGDYSSLRRFIERVESSDNFLVIDRVMLAGAREGGTKLQLNVEVATYFDAPWLIELQRQQNRSRRRGAV